MTDIRTVDEELVGLRDAARQLRAFWAQDSGTSIHLHAADRLDEAATRIEQLHTKLDTTESERADLWRKCRELSASCDTLKAANATLRSEAEQLHKEVETVFKDGFVSGFDHRGRTDDPDEAIAGAEREWAVRALTGEHNG